MAKNTNSKSAKPPVREDKGGIFNAPIDPIVRNYDSMTEYGAIGQKKYAGTFYEEYLPELLGKRGIETYKEMSESDSVIGSMLFATEMLMRQATWDVEPQGDTEKDKRAAEFIKECMDDMSQTWQDVISEILSFLVYGWSWHEICYKRRMGKTKDPKTNSKYDDGLIGWMKLPVRAQDTLWQWIYDDEDNLVGMSQMAPPDFRIRTIPKEKALHFVTKSKKANPEGRSILRTCYRDWYFKKRMQEIEGIGVARDLAGLPMITPPEGVDIWDASDPDMVRTLAYATKLVQNVRRDALEGIVVPHGWEFSLLNGGSKRQFEVGNIIERYDSRISMTILADFVLLGHQNSGSWALSSDKTELFAVALGAYMDIICEVFNSQGIPRLIDLNGEHFNGITDYPKLVHGDVETPNLTVVANYLNTMSGAGLIVPDENLLKYVRRIADLPESVEAEEMPLLEAMRAEENGGGDKGAQNGAGRRGESGNTEVHPDPGKRRTDGDKSPKEETKEELKAHLKKAWEEG